MAILVKLKRRSDGENYIVRVDTLINTFQKHQDKMSGAYFRSLVYGEIKRYASARVYFTYMQCKKDS